MPIFSATVKTWDSGGFEIEANNLEEAQEKVAGMERDELESLTEWRGGDYEAYVEPIEEDEP
jgi:hypothetical protein